MNNPHPEKTIHHTGEMLPIENNIVVTSNISAPDSVSSILIFKALRLSLIKNINPKTMNQWCFVDDEGHSWYFLRKVWFSDEADLDFPGFSKMAGVKKTDKDAKSKAVAILDDTLKK